MPGFKNVSPDVQKIKRFFWHVENDTTGSIMTQEEISHYDFPPELQAFISEAEIGDDIEHGYHTLIRLRDREEGRGGGSVPSNLLPWMV